jgi:hypothetical protein
MGVDASSIAVHRRYQHSQNDRREVHKLPMMLVRFVLGETVFGSWRRMPSVADSKRL